MKKLGRPPKPDGPSDLLIEVGEKGLLFRDRKVKNGGGFLKLAFLPYSSLELVWYEKKCDPLTKTKIQLEETFMQARRGKRYPITCGQTVVLGEGE